MEFVSRTQNCSPDQAPFFQKNLPKVFANLEPEFQQLLVVTWLLAVFGVF